MTSNARTYKAILDSVIKGEFTIRKSKSMTEEIEENRRKKLELRPLLSFQTYAEYEIAMEEFENKLIKALPKIEIHPSLELKMENRFAGIASNKFIVVSTPI